MKKLFISQPMRDKTNEEILSERTAAVKEAQYLLGDAVEVIDSFFEDVPVETSPLWYIGESIKKLAEADVAYFVDGWDKYRGCKIEHTCAVEYGVYILRD